MFGLAHFNLIPLLQAWARAGTETSMAHFVALLVYEVRIMSSGDVRLDNPFADALVSNQVAFWLSNSTVRTTWAEQLEYAILHGLLSEEQATQASLAYEVLAIGLDDLAAPPLGSSIILHRLPLGLAPRLSFLPLPHVFSR